MQEWTILKKRAGVGFLTLVLMGVLLCVGNLKAQAAEGFQMSTDYPGVTAKAGETINFELDFLSNTSCDVSLSIVSIPEGFTGFFRGTNGEISKVHVDSGAKTEGLVTFSLTLPDELTEGVYEVSLLADAGNGQTSSLGLDIVVNETEAGQSDFSAEYPEQEGASGTSFTFDTTLVNNRGTAQSYSLSAEAPSGWQVSFTPSGETSQVSSVEVEAGSSQSITVNITPPESITEGEYVIPCTAAASGETLSTDLTVTITGLYEVEVSTPTGNLSLDANANAEEAFTLRITNMGNVALENLNLTSSVPANWEMRFDESTIEVLEAGESKEITAYLTPDGDAITGDYIATVEISNEETSDSAEFRVSVKTRTGWGIFAVLIILLLIAGLAYVFKKYGRR